MEFESVQVLSPPTHLSLTNPPPLSLPVTLLLCVCARVRAYYWRELPQVSFLTRRQKYACRDKTVVVTNTGVSRQIFCRDKHNFVATKLLSRQAYFCRDKRLVLSRQTRVCRDKTLPKLCQNAKTLARQKFYLWQLPPMIDEQYVAAGDGSAGTMRRQGVKRRTVWE